MSEELLEESGVVVAGTSGGRARVKILRGSACGQCAAKKMCHSLGNNEMEVTAGNPLGAQPGQRVLLSLPGRSVLRASLIIYLIPLLALLGGATLGHLFSQAWSITGALLGLACSFGGIRLCNKRLQVKAYTPTISRIIN